MEITYFYNFETKSEHIIMGYEEIIRRTYLTVVVSDFKFGLLTLSWNYGGVRSEGDKLVSGVDKQNGGLI